MFYLHSDKNAEHDSASRVTSPYGPSPQRRSLELLIQLPLTAALSPLLLIIFSLPVKTQHMQRCLRKKGARVCCVAVVVACLHRKGGKDYTAKPLAM